MATHRDEHSDHRGPVLLAIARRTLEEALGAHRPPGAPQRPDPDTGAPWLHQPGATFITLRRADGELRGCIGSLRATRPLIDDLRENTLAAAHRDPRFPPVEARELADLSLEVSLLDLPRPMAVADEAEAVARLRPGIDGVVLTYGPHRATFLPQVWESLRQPRDFLAQLKHKAGLPPDFWHPDLVLERYTVEKWAEA